MIFDIKNKIYDSYTLSLFLFINRSKNIRLNDLTNNIHPQKNIECSLNFVHINITQLEASYTDRLIKEQEFLMSQFQGSRIRSNTITAKNEIIDFESNRDFNNDYQIMDINKNTNFNVHNENSRIKECYVKIDLIDLTKITNNPMKKQTQKIKRNINSTEENDLINKKKLFNNNTEFDIGDEENNENKNRQFKKSLKK